MIIEQKILGGIFANPETINDVIDFLQPKWFIEPYRDIWELFVEAYKDNLPIETSSIYLLSKKKQLEINPAFISKLSEGISSGVDVLFYSRVLYEKFLSSETKKLADETKNRIEKKEDIFRVLDSHIQRAMSLTQTHSENGELISSAVMRTVEHIEAIHSNKKVDLWVNTGFIDLDNTLKFVNGELIIIAARPSMGKTTLALNIARNTAKNDYTALFSLEMNNQSLATRMIATESGVSYYNLLTGKLRNEDGGKIARSAAKIKELKLYVDDTAGITPIQLLAKARRLKNKYDIKIIIIDYIGLMRSPEHQQREREISFISSELKALAKSLNIPVVVLSQLNRSVESRADKRPQLSDLRDSGSLEQDADSVIFLYRPEYYGFSTIEGEGIPSKDICQLIIAKNRNGAVTTVNLKFYKDIMKFDNLSRYKDEAFI